MDNSTNAGQTTLTFEISLRIIVSTGKVSKGLVTNYGEGGGATKQEGGAREVLPLQKGGAEKVLAMLKGGHKKFWGSFYAVA